MAYAFRPRSLSSFLLALLVFVFLMVLAVGLSQMISKPAADAEIKTAGKSQNQKANEPPKPNRGREEPAPKRGPHLVQSSGTPNAPALPHPFEQKDTKAPNAATEKTAESGQNGAKKAVADPPRSRETAQAAPTGGSPPNPGPFDSTLGSSIEGIHLPALEVVDLNSTTIQELLGVHKAHLVAMVRQHSGKQLNLLVRPVLGGSLHDSEITELTEKTLGELSNRGFVFAPDEVLGMPTALLEQRIAQKLGTHLISVTYRLNLSADFDRRIAAIQRQALARAGIDLEESHRKNQKVITRLRLLGPDKAPQVLFVKIGDKVLPVSG